MRRIHRAAGRNVKPPRPLLVPWSVIMHLHHSLAALAILVMFGTQSRAESAELPSASPEAVGMSTEKLNRVDTVMEKSIADSKIAGGIVMIAKDGKVVLHKAYGMMDRDAGKAMETDTIVRIYSMTKAITTAAAMMLVDDGKLAVTDPVSKYLPELENVTVMVDGEIEPAKNAMTIADLMRHTAGYSFGFSGDQSINKKYSALGVMDRDVTLADMQSKLGGIPLAFEPGTDWLYSISIDVLGRVIEVASNQPLDEFLSARIFQPLGMDDTGFYVPADKVDRFAVNYNSDGRGNLTVGDAVSTSPFLTKPAMLSGGGGLVSTAGDYMRFLLMIDNGGEFEGVRLLQPETVRQMITNQVPESAGWVTFGEEVRTGVGFGFGFNVRVELSDWDPDGKIGEYGWGGAASTHYWVSPQDNLIVITLEQVMPYQWHTEFALKEVIYDAL